MQAISESWKVAEIVDRWPQTVDVFHRYNCPDMQKGFFRMMSRLMSVKNAARVHRIPLDRLLADLNQVVAAEYKTEAGTDLKHPSRIDGQAGRASG